ncbi:MAG: hypothetical protein IPO41_17875 [Acidobacteria bacterium]|nr:hypothetical protein [Acidobacteriota bacterium]MBK9530128.1 hypothetical protein [Acidobacteriota bacterium]
MNSSGESLVVIGEAFFRVGLVGKMVGLFYISEPFCTFSEPQKFPV